MDEQKLKKPVDMENDKTKESDDMESSDTRKVKPKSFKETVIAAFSVSEDSAPNQEIQERLRSAGQVTGTNLCMMVCANLIASMGLNAGQMSVVVGAMLIEPLMGSILMLSYCTVSAQKKEYLNFATGFVFQIVSSIIAATIYFLLTPVKGTTPELLSMTEPTVFEVMIAIVGGVAAVIGMTRKEKANTIIPGVAIATALMPPLCACGYGIANLDPKIAFGAFYMFLVNAYFISLGACLVLSLFRIPMSDEMTQEEIRKSTREMIINTLLMLIPAVVVSVYKFVG